MSKKRVTPEDSAEIRNLIIWASFRCAKMKIGGRKRRRCILDTNDAVRVLRRHGFDVKLPKLQ
jgi:hypothetical protein